MKLKDVKIGQHFVLIEEVQVCGENKLLPVYQKVASGGITPSPREGTAYVTAAGALLQRSEDDEVILTIL
jgi:hypothetical protein